MACYQSLKNFPFLYHHFFSRLSNCKCAPLCTKKMISMRCCLLLTLLLVNQSDGGIGLSPWEFFLGNGGEVDKTIAISFKPEEGLRLREKFEKKYGLRGEKLISSLGDGLPVDEFGSQ